MPSTMASANPGLLLALAPGLRETGWAVFRGSAVAASGIAGLKGRRKVEPSARIAHQLDALSAVAARWSAGCAVRSRADGINWRTPGLEQLDDGPATLGQWIGYPVAEIHYPGSAGRRRRAAQRIQGRPVLRRHAADGADWAEPGHRRREAIAVGYYHLALRE